MTFATSHVNYLKSVYSGAINGLDFTPRRILKLAHQGAAPDRGRSLISTIALLLRPM